MPELLGFREKYKTGYAYDFVGNGGQDARGNTLVDCSQLMSLMLKDEGYEMGRLTTASLETSEKFDEIAQDKVIPGDLVLWRGEMSYGVNPRALYHVGVVESYDHATKKGNFFGSQSSTGPASAKFGASNWSYYWPNQTKFLRPKPQYKTGGAQQPAESPAPEAKPAIDAPMAFAFPIFQENNQPYATADEIYKLLQAESSGHYLVSNHNFWHGGLHFSNLGAPQCIRSSPLRCMADGEVVAYRLNKDYLKSEFAGETYQSSTSFCLVRHKYTSPKTDDGKTNTLEFYSLYMHLLPYDEYAKPDAEAKPRIRMVVGTFIGREGSDRNSRRYGAIPKGTEFEVLEETQVGTDTYAKGQITKGKVGTRKVGDQVWFAYKQGGNPYWSDSENKAIWEPVPLPLRKMPDYWQGEVMATVVNAQGLPLYEAPAGDAVGPQRVAVLNYRGRLKFHSGKTRLLERDGKKVRMAECTWISGEPRRDGVIPPTFWAEVENRSPAMLSWDSLTPVDFDEVVVTQAAIKAADPVGFFGLNEFPSGPDGGKEQMFQAHVEIFTADANLEKFLKNEAGLKKGKQYLDVAAGSLGMKPPSTEQVMLNEGQIVDLDKAVVYKDAAGAEWYEFPVKLTAGEKKVVQKKDQATLVCQHDWEKLGFQIIKETNPDADGFVDPDNMPAFFKELYDKINTDGDDELSPAELKRALSDTQFRDRWARLIAQHPTEWKDKSDKPKWEKLKTLLEESPELLAHQQGQIDKLVFWDDLAAAKPAGDGVTWHFHPVAFIANAKAVASNTNHCKACAADITLTVDLMRKFVKKSVTDERLQSLVPMLNKFFVQDGVTTCSQVAYILGQAWAETLGFSAFRESLNYTTASYTKTSLFNMAPTAIKAGFARKGMNLTQEQMIDYVGEHLLANDANYGKHCFGSSEYPDNDYRGRGLLHLTFFEAYKKCADAIGFRIDETPSLLETNYEAIVASGTWFWKTNKIGDLADAVSNDVDAKVKKVTRVINSGLKALDVRQAQTKVMIDLIKTEFKGCAG
ncbi:hypothetical protein [Pseudomonas sp. NPDC089406]|uniref:hypothetical protein n=1 Tax=Pseudomonas sp. NPDC089406 TaxID=3364463 RepID=UPI00384D2DF8